MWLQVGNKTTRTRLPLLEINFDGFSLLSHLHLHIVMKKIYKFPEKSELPKFIPPVEIGWLSLSAVSRVEMKNLQTLDQAHFLTSQVHYSILRSWLHHAC